MNKNCFTKHKRQHIDGVSMLQVRRAYEAHFRERIPDDLAYTEAARQLALALGWDEAQTFIESQSNDPNAPELILTGGE